MISLRFTRTNNKYIGYFYSHPLLFSCS
jgi:hypothetical protein